jgi:hypothetical protein
MAERQMWLECVICNVGFQPFNQVQLTCSDACSKKLSTQRMRNWRLERKKEHLPITKICKTCGKTFTPTSSTNASCSIECSSSKHKKQITRWMLTNKDKCENTRLKRMYGITLSDYKQMYRQHGGKCAICAKKYPKLCVDHNHHTGRVRGLLCRLCNAAIGAFKDDPQMLMVGVSYLTKYKEQNGK